jgi:hypothetical protein
MTQTRSTIAAIRSEWKDRLPSWMQPFLTWLLGYPYRGQKPLFGNKPWWLAVLVPTIILVLGMALAISLTDMGGFACLAMPIPWLMVVHGARTLQVHICHQGIHENLSGDPPTDHLIVEVVSTMLVVSDHDSYKHDHDGIHHPRLASEDDPDRQFTIGIMRIEPGADKGTNRMRFVSALFSPRIHWLFLAGRLRANFVTSSRCRRLMSLGWLAILVGVVMASRRPVVLAVDCMLPMTIIYQMSAMCQFVTEHLWARRQQPGQAAREHYLSLLLNRHLGDPMPRAGLNGREWGCRWAIWWARLFCYHLPVRLGILVADLPVHGGHHLWPLDRRWGNSIYTFRELSDQTGKSPIEVFGSFGRILDFVLESFSEARPGSGLGAPSPMAFAQAVKVTSGL